jgi:Domain of unknown function (DUF4386)
MPESQLSASPRSGRILGLLILGQMAGSVIVNAVLAAPLSGEPDFLVSAAAHPTRIGLSVLGALATNGCFVAIAIAAFPIFRERAGFMALWLVSLAIVSLTTAAAEGISGLSMLSLSQAYVAAAAGDHAQLQALAGFARSARHWSHFVARIIDGSTLLVLYAVLFRGALVPRALAGFGIAATVLQLVAVSMPLFGHPVVFTLLAPLGVSQLALALWLLMKGLRLEVP